MIHIFYSALENFQRPLHFCFRNMSSHAVFSFYIRFTVARRKKRYSDTWVRLQWYFLSHGLNSICPFFLSMIVILSIGFFNPLDIKSHSTVISNKSIQRIHLVLLLGRSPVGSLECQSVSTSMVWNNFLKLGSKSSACNSSIYYSMQEFYHIYVLNPNWKRIVLYHPSWKRSLM